MFGSCCGGFSCLLCCCGCCCCWLISLSIGLGAAYTLFEPAIEAIAQVGMCVNRTFGESHGDFFNSLGEHGACAEFHSKDCPPGDEPKSEECKELEAQCACLFTIHVSEMKDPTLEEGLDKCCDEVEKAEKAIQEKIPSLNVSELLSKATKVDGSPLQQCIGMVDKVSDGMRAHAKMCKQANATGVPLANLTAKFTSEMENFSLEMVGQVGGEADFVKDVKASLGKDAVAKFEIFDRHYARMLEKVHGNRFQMALMVGAGIMVAAVAMMSLAVRRTGLAYSHSQLELHAPLPIDDMELAEE